MAPGPMWRRSGSIVPRIASRASDRLRPWVGQVRTLYGIAGLALSCGLVAMVAGLWGLSILTEEVMEGDTRRLDRAALLWLNKQATPWLDQKALEVTALGDGVVISVIVLAVASILWLRGPRAYAAMLVAAATGAAIMTPVLKNVFDRPRPQLFEWRAHYAESSYAYPSGHAMMSMVTMVALAYVVHRLAERPSVSVCAAAFAGVLVMLTGLSRLYLGVHYPSDVLAGYAVGFAWVVLCALAAEVVRTRTDKRSATPETDQKTVHAGVER